MFEKILLAIDESRPSERAISAATALAKRFRSEVVVLQIPDRPAGDGFSAETAGTAASLADRVVMDLKDCGVSARPEPWMGLSDRVATPMAHIARHEAVDLIVIGATAPWGHRESFVGDPRESLPTRVLRDTQRPVLAVP